MFLRGNLVRMSHMQTYLSCSNFSATAVVDVFYDQVFFFSFIALLLKFNLSHNSQDTYSLKHFFYLYIPLDILLFDLYLSTNIQLSTDVTCVLYVMLYVGSDVFTLADSCDVTVDVRLKILQM